MTSKKAFFIRAVIIITFLVKLVKPKKNHIDEQVNFPLSLGLFS